jgi:hypothetical protein
MSNLRSQINNCGQWDYLTDRGNPTIKNEAVVIDDQRTVPDSLDAKLAVYTNIGTSTINDPIHFPGYTTGLDANLAQIWALDGRFPGQATITCSPNGSTPSQWYGIAGAIGPGQAQLGRLLTNAINNKSDQQFTLAFWIGAPPSLAQGMAQSKQGISVFNVCQDTGTSGFYNIRVRAYKGSGTDAMRFQVAQGAGGLTEMSYDLDSDKESLFTGSWSCWAYTFHFIQSDPATSTSNFRVTQHLYVNNHQVEPSKAVTNITAPWNSGVFNGGPAPMDNFANGGSFPVNPPTATSDPHERNYMCLFYNKKGGSTGYNFWGQYGEFVFFDKDMSDDHKSPQGDAVSEDPTGNILGQFYAVGQP